MTLAAFPGDVSPVFLNMDFAAHGYDIGLFSLGLGNGALRPPPPLGPPPPPPSARAAVSMMAAAAPAGTGKKAGRIAPQPPSPPQPQQPPKSPAAAYRPGEILARSAQLDTAQEAIPGKPAMPRPPAGDPAAKPAGLPHLLGRARTARPQPPSPTQKVARAAFAEGAAVIEDAKAPLALLPPQPLGDCPGEIPTAPLSPELRMLLGTGLQEPHPEPQPLADPVLVLRLEEALGAARGRPHEVLPGRKAPAGLLLAPPGLPAQPPRAAVSAPATPSGLAHPAGGLTSSLLGGGRRQEALKTPPATSAGRLLGEHTDSAFSALPSIGSAPHALRRCKPCAFTHKEGCQSGFDCKFCHLCPPGEKKQRKKERKEIRKAVRQQH